MNDRVRFIEKADQCRRLARSSTDAPTIAGLLALADEYDAKAREAEGAARGLSPPAATPADPDEDD